MSFPSDGGLEGIRVELRMIVSHDPEQRFDTNGMELVQFRGNIVDSQLRHPLVVVRFAGQQRAQLYRWVKPGKHISVVGNLEVKSWTDRGGRPQVALLIEARDVFPLNPDQVDHSREGVYAPSGRIGKQLKPRASKAEAAAQMRRLVDLADAG